MRFSTDDVRRAAAARFPLVGARPSAGDLRRILGGAPTRRSDCRWTPPLRSSGDDRALLRSLLLGPAEERLRVLAAELRLIPGDARAIVDLAEAVARQCLRHPVAAGERLERIDGRSGVHVCVGTKPAGFLEDWMRDAVRRREAAGETFAASRVARGEHLVWTVDPSSTRPGISQSPLSDWRTASE